MSLPIVTPTTVIHQLKHYLKYRKLTHYCLFHRYAWYAYTSYIIELISEEVIWSKTVAEKGKNGEPIKHGIGFNATSLYDRLPCPSYNPEIKKPQCSHKFQLQTGHHCYFCQEEMRVLSYDIDYMKQMQKSLINNVVLPFVDDLRYEGMVDLACRIYDKE
jgi:hypothetical protein